MTRAIRLALLVIVASAASLPAQDEPERGRGEKVDAYAEWRLGDCLIADGQRVCPAPGHRFKGKGEARSFATVPLGYELLAKGRRLPDGTLLAREVEAKPNGSALFEGEIRSATDQMEDKARRRGRFAQGAEGEEETIGRLLEDGPYVERVRRIVDTVLPPYLRPEDVRIYAIESKEWNAFAMGNRSIYVFTGLLDDMDDDEVAIIVGHELVHATHEHSRKQFKRDVLVQVLAAGALAATSTIDDDTKRLVASLVVALSSTAYQSGYGRGMEDQADRVGLRYAYEAGYDITKGPHLWERFAKKYGEGNRVLNFFFADHSRSAARAKKLRTQIAWNYPGGPKPDGPVRLARGESPPSVPAVAAASAPVPADALALVSAAGEAPEEPGTPRVEIQAGMTAAEVRAALGEPEAQGVFAGKTLWAYPDLTVVFVDGKVVDVEL